MKKYYLISESTDLKEVGAFFQIGKLQLKEDWQYWNSDSYITVETEGKIGYEVKFPIFGLQKRAKITDLLSNVTLTNHWLLVNNRFLNILNDFNIDEHQVFKVKVQKLKNGEIIDGYNMLFMNYGRHTDFIDWEKSKFRQITFINREKTKDLTFKNYAEHLELLKSLYDTGQSVYIDALQFR